MLRGGKEKNIGAAAHEGEPEDHGAWGKTIRQKGTLDDLGTGESR
jgi:hypothetical protein